MQNFIDFSLESFNTGKYSVVTRTGISVKIQAIANGKLIGFVYSPSEPSHMWNTEKWNKDGSKFFGVEHYHDLFLLEK
jgi:hypothetical protein